MEIRQRLSALISGDVGLLLIDLDEALTNEEIESVKQTFPEYQVEYHPDYPEDLRGPIVGPHFQIRPKI